MTDLALDPAARTVGGSREPVRGALRTPRLLKLAMLVVAVPVVLFAFSVDLGASRLNGTLTTVGQESTQGITQAQRIKLNLSDLDELVVEDLLSPAPAGVSGLPDTYNAQRAELDGNLVLAASKAPAGDAYTQPLANIDYALGHYHALVRDSLTARRAGDARQASLLYRQAHDVMSGTLLSQADAFDKANTYLLNNTYRSHKASAASSGRLIVVAWLVLLGVLAILQLWLAAKFRRLISLPMVAAMLVALVGGLFVLAQVSSSSAHLTTARELAFDPVHELARARATVVAARQTEGQLLLDPGDAPSAAAAFAAQVDKVFRLNASSQVATLAAAGQVPNGAGGYLATVVVADVSPDGTAAARRALVAFGNFLAEDARLRAAVRAGDIGTARALFQRAPAFAAVTASIGTAQAVDQATFDRAAAAARADVRPAAVAGQAAAAGVLALVVLGLNVRLSEYRR